MSGTLHAFSGFRAPGPVAQGFLADRRNEVRAILGPQGGGKTVTCIYDLLANAALQPACKNGRVRFRVAVVRDTYQRLEETTIKTWTEWIPRSAGEWEGGGGRQAHHHLRFETIRAGIKVPVEFEAIFAALGDQKVEDFMRGFEVTAFWFNEMDLLAEETLTLALGRIGRFPKQDDMPAGVTYRPYIIGDLNAPDIDSWFYKRFEEEKPQGFRLYKQPSGRSPRAENLHNLPPSYYERQVRLNASKPRWIRRFVDAQYGPSDEGEPVYSEYSDDVHLAPEPLLPFPKVPLRLGLDAGLQRPAAVFGQWLPNGQWRILDELVPGRMGAKRFSDLIRKWLEENGGGCPIGDCYADPAAWTGADREAGELAWVETIMAELSIAIQPAPSNEIALRCDAVRDELTYMIEANVPAFWLSPACKMLRKGFVSHYRYTIQNVGNSKRTSDKPEKNDWSHPHDALQYLLLGSKGKYAVVAADRHAKPGGSKGNIPRVLSNSWRPFA